MTLRLFLRGGEETTYGITATRRGPHPHHRRQRQHLEKRLSMHSERGLLKSISASSTPLQMLQEKLRFRGTQISLSARVAQRLVQFLCKEVSAAVMLSPIRKTLRCNQALPGGLGFRGINALPPCWLPFGQTCDFPCSPPSLPKNEARACSEVQHPEHGRPEAASLEPRRSQGRLPWSISPPVSFVERARFLLDPQRSVTKGGVIWTLDNDQSVFNETPTHMDNFFPKCLQCMVSTTMDYEAFLTALLTPKLVEMAFSRNYQNYFKMVCMSLSFGGLCDKRRALH